MDLVHIFVTTHKNLLLQYRGRHVRDRMIVGFTTTSVISAYHHKSSELKYTDGEVYLITHYVIKFVIDLRQVGGFSGYSGFLHQ